MTDNQSLKNEIDDVLNWLRGQFDPRGHLAYFYDIAREHFENGNKGKNGHIPIIGTVFPEEFILSCGLKPWWIPGGSLTLSLQADSVLPRDADSISRSIYGYLLSVPKQLPVIIPVTGDNPRKLSYLLNAEGRAVYPLELQGCDSTQLPGVMKDRLDDVMDDISLRWGLPGQRKRVNRAAQTVCLARDHLRNILRREELPGVLKLFLANTYFYADDLQTWAYEIAKLSRYTEFPPIEKRPSVLLVGSPILFPNYKVLRLIHSVGLEIVGSCDSINSRFYFDDDARDISGIAAQVCRHDCSGSQIGTNALEKLVTARLGCGDVQGVVVHVVKGQIEYDFAMNSLETIFARHGLPVFRLETDYHENDVEQLAIRLEAFSELLR